MTRLYVPSPWIGPGMARVRRQRPTHSRHVNLHVGALTSPDLHAFMNFTPRCIRELRDTVNITEFLHSETVNKWQNRLRIFLLFISAKSLLKFQVYFGVFFVSKFMKRLQVYHTKKDIMSDKALFLQRNCVQIQSLFHICKLLCPDPKSMPHL